MSGGEALDHRRGIFLITGAQAAGKSTVGRVLAERFDRAGFVDGDLMWKLIVSGREDWTLPPSEEALRQLVLRYRHGALLADSLFEHGFTAVHADIVMEHGLPRYAALVRSRPLYVVMLRPSIATVAARERGRRTPPTGTGRAADTRSRTRSPSSTNGSTTRRGWGCGSTPATRRRTRPSKRSWPGSGRRARSACSRRCEDRGLHLRYL